MKICQEELDGELYVDVVLDHEEIEMVKEYLVVAQHTNIEGKIINIGVRLLMEGEEDAC